MIIFVLDDGETYTISEPTPVSVTPEQLTRIEGGEKVYQVVPDWDERPDPSCNCVQCTTERTASRKIVEAQNDADDFFINVGIAAAEALKAKGGESVMDKYPGKLKATVVFTRNDRSDTDGIMADCLYLAYAGDGFADASCPVLHKMLFDDGTEYTAGWGASRAEIHISNWKHEAICGWVPRGNASSGEVNPLLHYDTKYKVCLKCRKKVEGGE